jgi:hypothetical protein
MAAVDYEILLYRRLKAILLAHAPLVTDGSGAFIRGGDWVWYDVNRENPEAPARVPSSFPRVALEPAGYTQEHWETRQRYADHNVNATATSLNRKVQITFNFNVRITHRDLQLRLNSPVEAEVMQALKRSNPTMSVPGATPSSAPATPGYDWIRAWGPLTVARTMGMVDEGAPDAPKLALRMMSVFPIPVVTVFNSADLLT